MCVCVCVGGAGRWSPGIVVDNSVGPVETLPGADGKLQVALSTVGGQSTSASRGRRSAERSGALKPDVRNVSAPSGKKGNP